MKKGGHPVLYVSDCVAIQPRPTVRSIFAHNSPIAKGPAYLNFAARLEPTSVKSTRRPWFAPANEREGCATAGLIPQLRILVTRISFGFGAWLANSENQNHRFDLPAIPSLPSGGNPRKLAKTRLLHKSGEGRAARRFSRSNKMET
jgi:hypothetical protein